MNWHWYLNYESDLQNITPDALNAYLEGNGWEAIKPYGDKGVIYASDAKGSTEIIAPKTRESSDYTLVLNQIIETLSKCEEREGLAIISDLSLAEYDKVSLRLSDEFGGSSISIDKGAILFHESRMLLRAAAYSALRPGRVFDRGNLKEVRAYLKNVRLGQTERGSFVVNLLSPVHSQYNRNYEPFSRQVTSMLTSGLQATRELIDNTSWSNDRWTSENVVKQGVSANLCDSLEKILGNERDESKLEFSVRWALTREQRIKVPSYIGFSNSDVLGLRKASLTLKNWQERSTKIQGYVDSLVRGQSQREGQVKIKTRIAEDTERIVSTDLEPSDYRKAVYAHGSRKQVSLIGVLSYENRKWHLRNPRNLTVIADGSS